MTAIEAQRIVWPRPGQVAIEACGCPPPDDHQVLIESAPMPISARTATVRGITDPGGRIVISSCNCWRRPVDGRTDDQRDLSLAPGGASLQLT
jgi:hypothetical protein